MVTINVRRLDEDVVDRLKRCASLNNRSLEGEVRHILECAAEDDMASKRAAFLEARDRLRQKTRGRKQTPAASVDVNQFDVVLVADREKVPIIERQHRGYRHVDVFDDVAEHSIDQAQWPSRWILRQYRCK